MSLKPIDRIEMLNRTKGWQGADRPRTTEKSFRKQSHISLISWESRSAKSYLRREQEIKSGLCQNKQVLGPEILTGWMIWSKTKFWCQLLQRNWSNLRKSQKNQIFQAFSAESQPSEQKRRNMRILAAQLHLKAAKNKRIIKSSSQTLHQFPPRMSLLLIILESPSPLMSAWSLMASPTKELTQFLQILGSTNRRSSKNSKIINS